MAAAVALGDVDGDGCEKAAREIAAETGASTLAYHCDVGDDEQCEGMIAATAEHFDGLDILLSNAGIIEAGDILTISREKFDQVLRVNLRAGFVLGQLAAREMVRRKVRGSILFMSSVNERLAIPNQLPYVVSKGGLSQLTRAMALGLAAHGIRVNAIGPRLDRNGNPEKRDDRRSGPPHDPLAHPAGPPGPARGNSRPSRSSSPAKWPPTSPARPCSPTAAACR